MFQMECVACSHGTYLNHSHLFHFERNQFRLDAQFQSDATLLVLSQAPIIFISNNKITRIPNKPTINNRSDCRPNVNWFGEAILRAHYTHFVWYFVPPFIHTDVRTKRLVATLMMTATATATATATTAMMMMILVFQCEQFGQFLYMHR